MCASEFASATMMCIVESTVEDGEWALLEWWDPPGLRGCGDGPSFLRRRQRGWFSMNSRRFADVTLAVTAVTLATAIGACALSGPQFTVTRWAPDQQGFGCPLEMVNPESGATLSVRRVESISVVPAGTTPTAGQDVIGDYHVTPEGALGVGRGQLLRIDCKTRQALAIVPASP
jgi:hypothetical protein